MTIKATGSSKNSKMIERLTLAVSVVLNFTVGAEAQAAATCERLFMSIEVQGESTLRMSQQLIVDYFAPAATVLLSQTSHRVTPLAASPSSPSFTAILGKIQLEANAALRSDRRERSMSSRPKVLTGDEQALAREAGTYAVVDSTARVASPSRGLDRMLEELRRAGVRGRSASSKGESVVDPVSKAWEQILKNRASDGRDGSEMTPDFLSSLSADPVGFAITYAQMTGLIGRMGQKAAELSPKVPWVGRVPSAHFYPMVEVAAITRALNAEPARQAALDQLVYDILKAEFAK